MTRLVVATLCLLAVLSLAGALVLAIWRPGSPWGAMLAVTVIAGAMAAVVSGTATTSQTNPNARNQ